MKRELTAGAAILALCSTSLGPAHGQEHRFAGFDTPRGTTAAVRVRIPIGGSEPRARRPSVAFTLDRGLEQGGADGRGGTATRPLRLLEFSLDRAGLQRARLAGLDIRTPAGDQLLLGGEGNAKNSIFLFFAFFLCVLTGVILLEDGDGGRRTPPDYVPPPPTAPSDG